jgi:hypothetical protein
LVIVNLSVEDNRHRAIFVKDRLPSAVDVDDRQTTHAQPDLPVEEKSVVVRTAPPDQRAHPTDQLLIDPSELCMNTADNTAHEQSLSD